MRHFVLRREVRGETILAKVKEANSLRNTWILLHFFNSDIKQLDGTPHPVTRRVCIPSLQGFPHPIPLPEGEGMNIFTVIFPGREP